MEWVHETLPYRMSDCKEELQPQVIHAFLQTSYWASHRTLETIERSIEGSFCIGLYAEDGMQVGFVRIVTDYAVFAWVCDVFVDPQHRGHGLGKWLIHAVTTHPALAGLGMVLGTQDAHGLYELYSFERHEMMRRAPQPAG